MFKRVTLGSIFGPKTNEWKNFTGQLLKVHYKKCPYGSDYVDFSVSINPDFVSKPEFPRETDEGVLFFDSEEKLETSILEMIMSKEISPNSVQKRFITSDIIALFLDLAVMETPEGKFMIVLDQEAHKIFVETVMNSMIIGEGKTPNGRDPLETFQWIDNLATFLAVNIGVNGKRAIINSGKLEFVDTDQGTLTSKQLITMAIQGFAYLYRIKDDCKISDIEALMRERLIADDFLTQEQIEAFLEMCRITDPKRDGNFMALLNNHPGTHLEDLQLA